MRTVKKFHAFLLLAALMLPLLGGCGKTVEGRATATQNNATFFQSPSCFITLALTSTPTMVPTEMATTITPTPSPTATPTPVSTKKLPLYYAVLLKHDNFCMLLGGYSASEHFFRSAEEFTYNGKTLYEIEDEINENYALKGYDEQYKNAQTSLLPKAMPVTFYSNNGITKTATALSMDVFINQTGYPFYLPVYLDTYEGEGFYLGFTEVFNPLPRLVVFSENKVRADVDGRGVQDNVITNVPNTASKNMQSFITLNGIKALLCETYPNTNYTQDILGLWDIDNNGAYEIFVYTHIRDYPVSYNIYSVFEANGRVYVHCLYERSLED